MVIGACAIPHDRVHGRPPAETVPRGRAWRPSPGTAGPARRFGAVRTGDSAKPRHRRATARVWGGGRLNLDGRAKPPVADDCGYLALEPDAVHVTGSQLPALLRHL